MCIDFDCVLKDRKFQKKKYSTEPFIFAPFEVVGFFIRNAVIWRSGSDLKYRDKLIAITNYQIVVVDPDVAPSSSFEVPSAEPPLHKKGSSLYNNPLDQSSSYQQNKLQRGDAFIPSVTVPHHSVHEYVIDGDQIKLETKDYRTITIDLGNIENATLRTQSLFMMKRYVCLLMSVYPLKYHEFSSNGLSSVFML